MGGRRRGSVGRAVAGTEGQQMRRNKRHASARSLGGGAASDRAQRPRPRREQASRQAARAEERAERRPRVRQRAPRKEARGADQKRKRREKREQHLVFPRIARDCGCGVMIHLMEKSAFGSDSVRERAEFAGWNSTGRAVNGVGRRNADVGEFKRRRVFPDLSRASRLYQALGALGHRVRTQILDILMDGPATYQTLVRATRQKAGPLYHHVNSLRLAGLVLPKQRDLYELTRGGRNLIVVGSLLARLVKDPRRRP